MKKILAISLVFVMLFSSTTLADERVNSCANVNVFQDDSEIMPIYTYLGFMSASLTIDENGHAVFSGSACAPYRYVRVKLYLQRSKSQLIWDDIQGTISTDYDSELIGEERNLPAEDYFYRAKVVAEVLDDNKNVIETATLYSSTERY